MLQQEGLYQKAGMWNLASWKNFICKPDEQQYLKKEEK